MSFVVEKKRVTLILETTFNLNAKDEGGDDMSSLSYHLVRL